jgi:hypothetical protein
VPVEVLGQVVGALVILAREGRLTATGRGAEAGRSRLGYSRRHRRSLCDPGKLLPDRHPGDANAWIRHHRHLERSGLTDLPSGSALSFR